LAGEYWFPPFGDA